jgi:DNA-binding transcriptional LysR family regulator
MSVRNLQGLTSFLEAASAGSFTAAATRLELSAAAVSKNVLRLERDIGVRLFNRHTRRIRLTAEGERFVGPAREALRALDDALAGVSQGKGEVSGRVRISVGSSFGRDHVLPVVPRLLGEHPRLEIEVSLDNRRVDLVAEGFDIGIRGGIARDSSLVSRRVCALPLVLLASPGYLARRGTPRSANELVLHDLIGVRFADGHSATWSLRPAPREAAVRWTPTARTWVSDPAAQLDLARADAGIVQVALHHAAADLAAGRLVRLLPNLHDPEDREIHLHYPHRQFLGLRVRVVVEALLESFAASEVLHWRPQGWPPSVRKGNRR